MGFDKTKLQITKASFDEATDLQDAIAKSLKGSGVVIPEKMNDEIDAGSFIDAALGAISDKSVRACLFKCAERALYDTKKINKDFFENEENRELYYPIMVEIVKENLGPLLKGLLSLFGATNIQVEKYLNTK